ncbi:MAG TPA: thioredoxin-dependent thiol peroxidase [bacterium]|nr:thioredoxin-dependent thiol peroxidase [bacterium]
MIKEGQKAPDFNLDDDQGKKVSLKDLKGKTVVLYFYPKDMTPGCTQEACDFRDNWTAVKKKGAVVLGVSADPVKRHKSFKEKYKLPFPLLSDEGLKMLKAYGVWKKKKFMGREFMGIVRTTLIIGPDGKIKKLWSPVSVKGHADDVLENL